MLVSFCINMLLYWHRYRFFLSSFRQTILLSRVGVTNRRLGSQTYCLVVILTRTGTSTTSKDKSFFIIFQDRKMVAIFSIVILLLVQAMGFNHHHAVTSLSVRISDSRGCRNLISRLEGERNSENGLDSFLDSFSSKNKVAEPLSESRVEEKGQLPFSFFSAAFGEPDSAEATATAEFEDNKFDMTQRIESLKCGALGAITGSLAVAPIAYLHLSENLPQWEFTTDMAALQGALFAIVYRYAIRNDENPMLNQGVVGAFVVVRTLANIQVSPACSALPLSCGEPLGYVDWTMMYQAAFQGLDSLALFGATFLGMDFAFGKGWISKFK